MTPALGLVPATTRVDAVEQSQACYPLDGRAGCRVRRSNCIAHGTTTAQDAGIGSDRADEARQCQELSKEWRVHVASLGRVTRRLTSPKGLPPKPGEFVIAPPAFEVVRATIRSRAVCELRIGTRHCPRPAVSVLEEKASVAGRVVLSPRCAQHRPPGARRAWDAEPRTVPTIRTTATSASTLRSSRGEPQRG